MDSELATKVRGVIENGEQMDRDLAEMREREREVVLRFLDQIRQVFEGTDVEPLLIKDENYGLSKYYLDLTTGEIVRGSSGGFSSSDRTASIIRGDRDYEVISLQRMNALMPGHYTVERYLIRNIIDRLRIRMRDEGHRAA